MKKMYSLILSTVASMIAVACNGAMQGYVIEEVIVTSQKRAESLQDVPISVTALSGEDLIGLKLRSSTEIGAQVPNMQIQTPYGDSQPVIALRGVSMSDYSHNQSSPVAMYVDEVYKSVGALQALQLFDLERIEVLRGPQGTLYGKNATGGAVNFITRQPEFERAAYLTLGIGNYNRWEVNGAVQEMLIDDTLAVRAALMYTELDGYVENRLPGFDDQSATDDWAARVSVLYAPVTDLEALLRFHKSRSEAANYGTLGGNIGSEGLGFGGYTREGLDFHENESDRNIEKDLGSEGLSLTVNWKVDGRHTLTSITAYDEGDWFSPEDGDGSPLDIDHNDYFSEVRQITQEFRLSSEVSRDFDWIVGLYAGRETVDASVHYRFFNEFPESSLNQRNEFTQTRTSFAAYWHTTYDLTEMLTLTLGLRYTEDESELEQFRAFVGGIDPVSDMEVLTQTIPAAGDVVPTLDFVDRDWSGKVGLDWRLSEDLLLYVSYSEGYRSGAFNGQAFVDIAELTQVEPEEVKAWELGIKTRLYSNRLQLNGAVFHYDYTDQQFLNVLSTPLHPTLLQLLVNADESQVLGAELELLALPVEAVSLRLGLGFLDSEYKTLTLGGVDLSGNELITAPEWNINAALDWEVVAGSWGTLALHLDSVYTDDQFFDAANTERISQKGYWISNGRLALRSEDDRYDLALWVKNIEDKHYTTYALDLQAFFNYDIMNRGQPRTYGAEITWRY